MLELQVGVALQSIRLRELGKADAAVAKLIADYNDHPKIGKALFQIGEEHYYGGNYPKTIELLEVIESNYPDSNFPNKEEVGYMLGHCYQLLNNHDKAVECYRKTVEEEPGGRRAAQACHEVGMIYFSDRNDYGSAVEWLEREQQLCSGNKDYGERGLFSLVVLYARRLEDYERGIEAAGRYLVRYPEGVGLWGVLSNLSRCYEKLGRTAEAIETLQRAYDVRTEEGLRKGIMERINRLEQGGGQ
ncbi:MAG: tetratricopeptide repeat protein, partial [Planctomycetota bacterium]|jgi:tetratricopeptide (TPR) repeat protein